MIVSGPDRVIGHYPCPASHRDGCARHHCDIRVLYRYPVIGRGWEVEPHEGRHRCRCGFTWTDDQGGRP